MKVSLVQMNSISDKPANIAAARALIEKAVAEEAPDWVLLPGGVANPDALRLSSQAIDFVRAFVEAEKPIAAICHGPWTLIDAGGVSGKRVTSWPSLKTDLTNAGAHWFDEAVVEDRGLVTSRNPGDIPKFNIAMIALFAGEQAVR